MIIYLYDLMGFNFMYLYATGRFEIKIKFYKVLFFYKNPLFNGANTVLGH